MPLLAEVGLSLGPVGLVGALSCPGQRGPSLAPCGARLWQLPRAGWAPRRRVSCHYS